MIFPELKHDSVVQLADMFRLDASKTFVTPDEGEITNIQISFDQIDYINIFVELEPEKWFLDYAFDSVGEKDIYLKVTTESGDSEKQFTLNVITEEEDALFSKDERLFSLENEFQYNIPKGRNSYKYAHREAQKQIVRYLDGEGVRKEDGSRFEKEDLVGNEYISEWSTYLTMILVLEDNRILSDDVYKEKRKHYNTLLIDAKKNAPIRLDFNQDEEVEPDEIKNVQCKFLER